MLGNYIGFGTAGNYTFAFANGHCFPGCEANDNGQGVNLIDGTNRTIVDGNWIEGLRSGVAVNAPVSKGNIIRNNFIGIAPNGGAGVINRYGVLLTWQTSGQCGDEQQDRQHGLGRHRPGSVLRRATT